MKHFQKYLLYGAVGLLVYMPFHIFFSQWFSTYTGGLEAWKILKDIFAALLTLLCVVTVLFLRKFTRLYLWLLGITVVYTALHLIMMFATNQPHDTGLLATVYNTRIMWFVLIGYSLALLNPKEFKKIHFTRILLTVSTIVCLVAFIQWLLPKDLMTHFGYSVDRGVKPNFFIDDKPDLPRVFSTLRDPNSLGAFLLLPSTLTIAALIRYWKTSRRMFFGGLVLLHGVIIVLTFSRSAWLAAFVAHGVVIMLAFREHLVKFLKRYAVPIGVITVLLFAFAFVMKDQYVVQNVIFHSDENTKLTDSNNLHAIQIQKGLEGIKNQPFGHGPGTAGLVSVHNKNGGLLTENYFVQIAYEVGIEGLLIFLGFLYLIIRRLWESRQDTLAQALLASFVGLVIMNMLLHTWANEAVACTWFMLAGFSLKSKL